MVLSSSAPIRRRRSAAHEPAACIAYRKRYTGQCGEYEAEPKPLVGSFGDGLYEVRTSLAGNIYRVFFCIEGSSMVLLHAFMKKTEKTPDSELEVARKRQKKVKS